MAWLVNWRKILGGFKDKVISLFKTNIPKQKVYGRGKKLNKPKTQNKIDSLKPFYTKKEKKRKKNIIDRII